MREGCEGLFYRTVALIEAGTVVEVLDGEGDRGARGLGIGGEAPGGNDVKEEALEGDRTELGGIGLCEAGSSY